MTRKGMAVQTDIAVKGILFDLWGTLVYNVPRNSRADYDELAERIGVSTEQIWRKWASYSIPSIRGQITSAEERARLVLADLGASLDFAPEMAEFEYRNRAADVHFFPGAEAMLEEVRERGYCTCLVSNCNYLTRAVVDRMELPHLMNGIVLSYEVGLIKPEPAIYQLAARTIGMEVQDCLFVGDGGDGELTGARSVGCRVALVAQERGHAFRNPEADYPFDIKLPNVADILKYLPPLE